jgi:hypothetical protein
LCLPAVFCRGLGFWVTSRVDGDWLGVVGLTGLPMGSREGTQQPSRRPRLIPSLLTQLGLAGVLAGFVLTALARAKKLGGGWEERGLWAIFAGFALIMVGVVLAIATSE